MAGEMYNYLSVKAADYTTTTLTVKPADAIPEKAAGVPVLFVESDDGTIETVILSSVVAFNVNLIWSLITPEEAGTIADFYYDPNKANRGARTIQWTHPLDGHTYVVRMMGDLEKVWRTGYSEAEGLTLKVEGKVS